ncbi:phasin family protein [Micromonospora mirobrigensis]|uniref:Polyhydroxyalkanoate synthesis regulator phasin n=1 Tax=Micromonospora mirobrigensis TaxID=262898 RepID=A0A1C5ALP4_9ACTN|nr:hypothetical protein [Micromonospora mirobrigensis]SCF46036.1 Polyhydroxyalkanoate synthesis regulator phasin [Micromonospora mirobrigensis]
MQDAWRAYLELAMGLTEAPRKRVQDVVSRLVGSGGATAAQLQALGEELVSTGVANRESLTKLVRFEVDRALGAVGLATADEVAELTRRVHDLESRLREAKGGQVAPVTGPSPVAPRSGPTAPTSDRVPGPTSPAPAASAPTAAPAQDSPAAPVAAPVARKAVVKKVAKKAVAKKAPTTVARTDDQPAPTVAKKAAPARRPADDDR